MICAYCQDSEAVTRGPFAGYCSHSCKQSHMAYLARTGEAHVTEKQAIADNAAFKAEVKSRTVERVENNGVATCSFPGCHSKLSDSIKGSRCWRHAS
jgi:hypothetical protein